MRSFENNSYCHLTSYNAYLIFVKEKSAKQLKHLLINIC
jgi:hypothetical protein